MTAPNPRCPRCRVPLRRGHALLDAWTESREGTCYPNGSAGLVPVWKCKRCGYSRKMGDYALRGSSKP